MFLNIQRQALAFSILFLSACAFQKDEAPEPKTPSEEMVETLRTEQARESFDGTLTEENVKVWFEAKPTPNVYTLNISWPKEVIRVELQINDTEEIIISNKNSYSVTVEDNTEYRIKIKSHGNFGNVLSIIHLTKTSPADLVFNREVHLQEDLVRNVNRIFFLESGKLITNGNRVSIQANQLYANSTSSENAPQSKWKNVNILTTIPETIANSKEQLNGSNIFIQAKKATGKLSVAMIGFDGQAGRSGDELNQINGVDTEKINPSLNGSDGADALIREKKVVCIRGNMDSHCEPSTPFCATPPTSGTAPKNGAPGTAGEDGWNGGNTGNLIMLVEDASNFSISVIKKVGAPGAPGIGAKGFVGGKAGRPGANNALCPIAAQLPDGQRGDKGPDGKTGDLGKEGTFDISPMKVEISAI